MRRFSTALSMIALSALTGVFFLPQSGDASPVQVAAHKLDFSNSGIDFSPVGTAKQMVRLKRTRTERKV